MNILGRRESVEAKSDSGRILRLETAVALANGMADVAFGTDTAGSIRVPAACCGVVGLKTTFGLVPIEGVYPIEPNRLDTVGPMAKDIAHTVQAMELLQTGFSGRRMRLRRPQSLPREAFVSDALNWKELIKESIKQSTMRWQNGIPRSSNWTRT